VQVIRSSLSHEGGPAKAGEDWHRMSRVRMVRSCIGMGRCKERKGKSVFTMKGPGVKAN